MALCQFKKEDFTWLTQKFPIAHLSSRNTGGLPKKNDGIQQNIAALASFNAQDVSAEIADGRRPDPQVYKRALEACRA